MGSYQLGMGGIPWIIVAEVMKKFVLLAKSRTKVCFTVHFNNEECCFSDFSYKRRSIASLIGNV